MVRPRGETARVNGELRLWPECAMRSRRLGSVAHAISAILRILAPRARATRD